MWAGFPFHEDREGKPQRWPKSQVLPVQPHCISLLSESSDLERTSRGSPASTCYAASSPYCPADHPCQTRILSTLKHFSMACQYPAYCFCQLTFDYHCLWSWNSLQFSHRCFIYFLSPKINVYGRQQAKKTKLKIQVSNSGGNPRTRFVVFYWNNLDPSF